MKIKLAEALLRRKELQEKVDQLRATNVRDLYEIKAKRQPVMEGIDDLVAQVPKVSFNQIMAAYDFHSRRLRMIDALIQQSNWTAEIEVEETMMDDFVDQIVK